MTTTNFSATASTDDATEASSTHVVTVTGSLLGIGAYTGQGIVGIRYRGTAALAGSTINSVTLAYYSAAADTSTAWSVVYSVENTATPAAYAVAASNISGRTYYGTTVTATGTDFGSWTSGSWNTLPRTGQSTPTIKDLIQYIATTYTPTDIAVMIGSATGAGYRRARSYDYSSGTYKPYMTVDYTAVAAPQALSPTVITAKATAPVPTLTPGEMPLEPGVIGIRAIAPAATLTPGAYTMSPPVVTAKATAFAPTLTPGSRTMTPPVVTAKAIVPLAILTTTGAAPQNFTAPVVTAKAIAIAPTLTGESYTMSPPVVTAKAITKVATLTPGDYTMAPPVVTAKAITKTPQLLPGSRTMSPPVVVARAIAAQPLLTTSGGALYVQYRDKAYPINVAQYPTGTVFYLMVWVRTENAGFPVYAFLYDTTIGQEVTDSRVSSTSTTTELKVSTALTLTGNHNYIVKYGGANGCPYHCNGAVVKTVSG